ncbi:GSCOCT00014257001.2-RA-CDS [Cotesia congregata]|uniref:Cc_bv2.6_30.4b n=1 Tax=Cotesia congregata TaxID=51543 RepID=S6D9I2_COTCN|nr:GSCOCT00014257001.2-RA-CDS [Cotesia congregata]CAG5092338.1 cc_bv2.6_30.4b [Cotesia congregata]CCQ71086.1 hypothetical protein BV2-6 [Cotesia congregata]
MLSITVATLLVVSNVIPRIQAEGQEERKAQHNGMQRPVYKSNSVIEALKVQKRETLNIVPESYLEQTNHVDKSQNGRRLRRDLNLSDFMPDLSKMWSSFNATSNKTEPVISYGSRTYQRNNIYPESDGKNVVYGSQDVQIGNTFSDNPNGTNVYGPIVVQENNDYRGKNKNAQYGASITQIGNKYPEHPGKNDIYTGVVVQNGNTYPVNPGNKTSFAIIVNQSNNTYPKSIENNTDALKPVIHQSGNFYPSSNDLEAGMKTKNNTERNSPFTNHDSDSSSTIERTTLYNKKSEAYAEKHTESNRQMSLSSNVFYSLLYSLIILFKYSLF